tara:strand:- start:133 stop:1017 length:885 start_codon:yes stop_codon:yes gene_type:complete
MKECPIFHIGLPKCASTYLQEVVFPKIKTWNYIRNADEKMAFLGNPYYKLPKEMSYLKNERNLISHEEIAEPIYPCSISDSHYMEREYGLSNTLRVIRDSGFVLVVIRRQDDWLNSIIKAHPVYNGKHNNVFLDYPRIYSKKRPYFIPQRYGNFLVESIDHYKLFIRISSLIGRERIKILLYEDLVHDPMLFFTQLSEIFEEDLLHLVSLKNEKRNVSKIKVEQIPFCLRHGIRNRFGHIAGVKFIVELMNRLFFLRRPKYDKKSRSNFLAIFKEHNRRLADEFNLDSGKYGYF